MFELCDNLLPGRLTRPLIGRFLLQAAAAPCALQGRVRANALFHHRAAPKAAHHSSGMVRMGGALPSASEHRADAARAARPPTHPPCTSSPRFVDLGGDVEAQIVEDSACVLGVHVHGKLGRRGASVGGRCRREDRVVWLVLLVEEDIFCP